VKRPFFILVFSMLFQLLICSVPGEDVKIWSIQLFSSKDSAKANVFAADLDQKGFSPVSIREKNNRYSVSVGEFKCYSDAVYYKKKLREAEFKDAFITSKIVGGDATLQSMTNQNLKSEAVFVDTKSLSVENPLYGRKIINPDPVSTPRIIQELPEIIMNAENNTLGETDLLKKAYALGREANISDSITAHQDLIRFFPESKNLSDSSLSIANLKLKQGNIIEAKTAYENVITQFSGKNHAGEACLRLAYLKMREKDSVAAKILFQSITSGNVTASDEVKREAEQRLAKLDRRDKMKNDPAFILLHQGCDNLKDGKVTEAEITFNNVINTHPISEAAGEASLRLAYIKRSRAKESTVPEEAESLKSEALSHFESVARGDIKANPDIQLEAMNRCAKIYHSKKENIRALQAFREIALFTDADGTPDPEIHVAIAGLYMELARSGKGSLDDCIIECDIVLSVKNATNKNKATALQMKAESFHFKDDYKKSIELEKELLEKYPEEKEMAMLANFYIGLSRYKDGDPYRAQKAMEKVEKNFSDIDNLPGNDLRLSSRLYQAQALIKMEKRYKAKIILEGIIKSHPDSKEAKYAIKLIEVLK
jgi:TolA-binding protein